MGFKLDTTFNTKVEAQRFAKKVRDKGKKARVRKMSGLTPNGKRVPLFGRKRWIYGVYTD